MVDAVHVATVRKNAVEEVRIGLSSYQGHALVDLRVYAEFGDDAERRPTKKGVALKVDRLPALIEALQAAEREAQSRGLLTDGGAA